MTRINVLPPRDLCDEHLRCEVAEILRVPAAIMQMAARGKRLNDIKLAEPGSEYTLGIGHVRFFYDKLLYLHKRHLELVRECNNRGFLATNGWPEDVVFPAVLYQDYEPTKEAILINLRRLTDKFTEKFRPTYSPHIRRPINGRTTS